MSAPKKEIPLSTEMIQAVRLGKKTQARFPINPQPDSGARSFRDGLVNAAWQAGEIDIACPFGGIGDEVWFPEEWGAWLPGTGWLNTELLLTVHAGRWNVIPRSSVVRQTTEGVWSSGGPDDCGGVNGLLFEGQPKWWPANRSPEWCRETLTLEDVQVERLQQITEASAQSEGFWGPLTGTDWGGINQIGRMPSECFSEYWDRHHAPGEQWSDDPWVWVIEFRGFV